MAHPGPHHLYQSRGGNADRLEESEAVGKRLRDVLCIVNGANDEPADSPVERVLRGGVTTTLPAQAILVARDGTRRPVDDKAAPIRAEEGQVVGAVMVFRDVTERRHMEDALREADRRMLGLP